VLLAVNVTQTDFGFFSFFQYCLGKAECVIPVNKSTFEQDKKDSCPKVEKKLAVQVKCGRDKKN